MLPSEPPPQLGIRRRNIMARTTRISLLSGFITAPFHSGIYVPPDAGKDPAGLNSGGSFGEGLSYSVPVTRSIQKVEFYFFFFAEGSRAVRPAALTLGYKWFNLAASKIPATILFEGADGCTGEARGTGEKERRARLPGPSGGCSDHSESVGFLSRSKYRSTSFRRNRHWFPLLYPFNIPRRAMSFTVSGLRSSRMARSRVLMIAGELSRFTKSSVGEILSRSST